MAYVVKLNRSPNSEESDKDSNFNGKTITYPGFEPGTSGLAVGSYNFGSVSDKIKFSPTFRIFLTFLVQQSYIFSPTNAI
jgi:hypothetical protein